jgi:hypothetical protein
MVWWWCSGVFFALWMGATLATFGGHHFNTVLAAGCKYTVEPSQVYSWFEHQRSQFGNKIEWFKNDVRGSIVVGRFELGRSCASMQSSSSRSRMPLFKKCIRWGKPHPAA